MIWKDNAWRMPSIQEGSVWKLHTFLVMFRTRTWNRKYSKSFNKFGCEILSRDIEASHRLTNNDRIILKFLRRKDCDQVLSVKRDLRKVKLKDIGLRGNNSIFINPSLCPYYRMLWSKSKRLLDLGKINNFYVSSGKIKIRIQENSKPLSITHAEDFKKYFPDVDLTPSS